MLETSCPLFHSPVKREPVEAERYLPCSELGPDSGWGQAREVGARLGVGGRVWAHLAVLGASEPHAVVDVAVGVRVHAVAVALVVPPRTLVHRAVLEQHPPLAVLLVALPLAAVARAW